MAEDLPNEFDLIVVGTGFNESIVAAAASRIFKTVLHLDSNPHYGGGWASLNLEDFNTLLTQENKVNLEVRNCSHKWYIPAQSEDCAVTNNDGTEKEEDLKNKEWLQSDLLSQSRRFNIDLCPKIMYSAGKLVKLLISSNVSRYGEFRSVDHVCTRFNNEIVNVPCSRSDIFSTTDLNVIEKRLLMKFLNICLAYGEGKYDEDLLNYHDKTFFEYLTAQKVTDKIAHCIMQAIAMCTTDTSFEDGMERTKRFIESLGRYGNTPFLFPMYGCGELPQCFCRICAVFGGIYCLNKPIKNVSIDTENNEAVVELGDRTVRAKKVVISHYNVPSQLEQNHSQVYGMGALINTLSRGVFITKTPLGSEALNSGGGGVNLLRLLADGREAYVIQLSHYSATCPKGLYLIHITTPAVSDNPESDLDVFAKQIFEESNPNSPKLLYSAYFSLTGRTRSNVSSDDSDKSIIFCTASPCFELDYDLSIQDAEEIFEKIFPNSEFLPRAPNPEEILIEGEDPCALTEVLLEDDLKEQLKDLNKSTVNMDIDENTDGCKPNSDSQPQEMDAE